LEQEWDAVTVEEEGIVEKLDEVLDGLFDALGVALFVLVGDFVAVAFEEFGGGEDGGEGRPVFVGNHKDEAGLEFGERCAIFVRRG
jgi:hypothetical protein